MLQFFCRKFPKIIQTTAYHTRIPPYSNNHSGRAIDRSLISPPRRRCKSRAAQWHSGGSLAFPRNRKINFHGETRASPVVCRADVDVLQELSRVVMLLRRFSRDHRQHISFIAFVTGSACCVTQRPPRIHHVLNSTLRSPIHQRSERFAPVLRKQM